MTVQELIDELQAENIRLQTKLKRIHRLFNILNDPNTDQDDRDLTLATIDDLLNEEKEHNT